MSLRWGFFPLAIFYKIEKGPQNLCPVVLFSVGLWQLHQRKPLKLGLLPSIDLVQIYEIHVKAKRGKRNLESFSILLNVLSNKLLNLHGRPNSVI